MGKAALTPISTAHLQPIDDKDSPRGRLSLEGMDRALEIPGRILEAAWQIDDNVLVATTDDIPAEDQLHFLLLNSHAELIDHVTLGAAYSTGAFIAAHPEGAQLSFRFFGDTPWTLTVLPKPTFCMPAFGNPRGVHRPFSFWTRLRMEGQPKSGA
ncbi:hypothetical protein [Roseospira navarrensis]|uniref:Uncharacterized protein n=1 Tax=Roseospira navarrensis TaxID=140058 RepID=A0A7X1ZD79_9PROT|nr:hypothetical protein [Roseospira navarrensis]MQX35884.1 hypothetical protein [Roseospira navarrensis]